MADSPRKLVRSYRLVFRRRWRIHKVQNWRIPLPQGIELRAIGYWAACLAAVAALAHFPLIGLAVSAIPPSVRLLAAPIAAAWALSRWEVDGRSPHRALLGLIAHRLRPRELAGLRRCPLVGSELVPMEDLIAAPDPLAPTYPRCRIVGPAALLLRYPAAVEPEGIPRRAKVGRSQGAAAAARWRIRETSTATPLHQGHVLQIPDGKEVIFE
jgi:hypothetical protein